MKLDFKEIAKAWYNKLVHTAEQKKLADERFEICLKCPSKKEVFKGKEWSLACGECGCPLSAKVYTDETYLSEKGSCPLGKWREVEAEHLIKTGKLTNIKKIKSII
jgi:hypothetical protein